MRFSLPSRRFPRHPMVRALSLLIGVAVLGVVLFFGLMVAGVLLMGSIVWLIRQQWTQRSMPKQAAPARHSRPSNILEGEFVVVRR